MDLIIAAGAVIVTVHEYRRREARHHAAIAALKEGIVLPSASAERSTAGLLLTGIVALAYLGFMVWLMFFFPIHVAWYLFLPPLSILPALAGILLRDLAVIRSQRKEVRP